MSILKSLFKRKDIRVRFAPSPTGLFHIGSARSTLFNFLFAKTNGGKFILRIEDTDQERSKPEYEKDILESIKWLGLNWDEFYRQSERLKLYAGYIKKLLLNGSAFYCFHSKEFLENEYEEQIKTKKNPAHHCEFRKLPIKDVVYRLNKESGIIRFKTPLDFEISFTDLIRGKISFNSDTLGGDFSLAKVESPLKFTPVYNLAVVIDDYEMKISHVIRGEEHISNTPKQILIQRELNLTTPEYAHLPLILAPDRSKLSKRHGAASVMEYREMGYLPETLVNFLALLGWNPGSEKEIFTLAELIKKFDLGKVQKGGAIFNTEKLDWLNGHYIRSMPIDELTKKIIPFLKKSNEHEVNIVICDRYYYSTIAFQSTQGIDMKMLIEKNKKFLKPDIAFIMDVDPEIALDRIKERRKEKFEELEFMRKLRDRFLELPKLLNDNVKAIDASKSQSEVFEDIKKEVDKLL